MRAEGFVLPRAKVAGSNPVFRSNQAPDSVGFSAGSGAFRLPVERRSVLGQ